MKYFIIQNIINNTLNVEYTGIGTNTTIEDYTTAIDKSVPKHRPIIHISGKSSDERQIGRFDLMSPLWQSTDSLLFSDTRLTIDNQNSLEGNIGMGYRHIIPGTTENKDWIFGIYGFYDIRRSRNYNTFNQGTLGIEMLKTNFEFRGNIYIPENKSYIISSRTVTSVNLIGTSIIERTQSFAAFERALPGFDAQVGYGFDIGSHNKLWIHAGYFHFKHSDSPEISGPRFNLNFEMNDIPGMPESTLNIGFEHQHDQVRDTSTYACISFSIPFGKKSNDRKLSNISRKIESRMMRQIVRDVDIVTNPDNIKLSHGQTGGPKIISDTETSIIDSASGEQIDMYFISKYGSSAGLGTQENPMTIVQAQNISNASDILFLLNDDGEIDVNTISSGTLTLKPYQKLLGIGDDITKNILLPNDLSITVNSDTGRPGLTNSGDNDVVKMNSENNINGITISGGNNGIYGININNPGIIDVTIQNVNNNAISLTNTAGTVTISQNNLNNNNLDAVYLNYYAGGNTSISISDNNFSNNNYRGLYISNSNGSTISGNIQNNIISQNGAQGIYLYNTTSSNSEIDIIDNQITENANEGLRLFNYTGGTINSTLQNNIISGNQDDNIYGYNNEGTMNLNINNNYISGSSIDAGIRINNLAGNSIFSGIFTNNTISGNLNQGMSLYNNGSDFSITARNNTITGNLAGGIDFDTDSGTSTLTIENNIISDNIGGVITNDIGIAIDQDTDPNSSLTLTLNNNYVQNNGYRGIMFDNANGGVFNASLTGNHINNNGIEGLYLINQSAGTLTANFSNNSITENGSRGLWLYNNSGTMYSKFENNKIAMNYDDGLELDNIDGGIFDFDFGGGTLGSLGQNSIFANSSGIDIDNDTNQSISAENNWWGLTPPNPARFSGTIDYSPWLTDNPN